MERGLVGVAYSGLSTHHVFKEDILKELREIRTRERTHALFNCIYT